MKISYTVFFLDHPAYRNVINFGGQRVEKSGKISRIFFSKMRLSSVPILIKSRNCSTALHRGILYRITTRLVRKDLQYVSDTFHLPDEFLHKIWRKYESNNEAYWCKNCSCGKLIHITYSDYVPIALTV